MCQIICGTEVVIDKISISEARKMLCAIKYPQPAKSPIPYILYSYDECNEYAYCRSMEFNDVKALLSTLR